MIIEYLYILDKNNHSKGKALVNKINKTEYIKIKFCRSKDTILKME